MVARRDLSSGALHHHTSHDRPSLHEEEHEVTTKTSRRHDEKITQGKGTVDVGDEAPHSVECRDLQGRCRPERRGRDSTVGGEV